MDCTAPVSPIKRSDYKLQDSIWAKSGTVFLTGTQALVRVALMQRQRDADRGLDTRGFISGYRGSPLGMVDKAIWSAGAGLAEAGVQFMPAINEELAATQVLGTQRVEADPERTTAGVFALWYGKGPGVDRAGDALKHGNAYGSSPHGGVLVVAGDDHGCVSSSMPHQSDQAFIGWSMPILQPASVAELLEFGLYSYALSRYSGAWIAMAALSEVVESATTVDLDALEARISAWQDADAVREATGHRAPADGLHNRWPDFPSLRIETRLTEKLDAVAAFARLNSIDRLVIDSPQARVGIVTCGKAHHDLVEALRRLGITTEELAEAGVRLYKVGLAFPLEQTRIRTFAEGLKEILVVEEKAPIVEGQLRDLFYNAPADARPALIGKRDRGGRPLVPATGELRPSRIAQLVADWLVEHFPDHPPFREALRHVGEICAPALPSNASDSLKRLPYFCAGCPHNTSTKVPEGSTARAGIGCHFMANWMDRDTSGLIQMGGEGVDWISHALFTRTPHIFQNLGDGTYYHSGYLAIRQAVAARATITYKILFNDAVAMTGGQPVDGVLTVDALARQVRAEGVARIVVVSDALRKYATLRHLFPAGVEFFDRRHLDNVQRHLRETPGVSVLIYEQVCAAEKRRRRKRGEPGSELRETPRRLVINEAVCEGCGDCTVQSNCVAVVPHETSLGRKRRIDQTTCNKDYACAQGFCPSFVTVSGATPRRRARALPDNTDLLHDVAQLSHPAPHVWSGPYDLLIGGIGGTGVLTVGAVIAMAAHLEGKSASLLDFMGFAQKGGAVSSYVRLAADARALNQVRIDTQQADAILACDLVVGASADALKTVQYGRTRVLANVHQTPVAGAPHDHDSGKSFDLLLDKLRGAAGDEQVETLDAQALAEEFLGDTTAANILALGWAWQRGLVPVSFEALHRALELNGVAIEHNQLAFALGRIAAADPSRLERLRTSPATTSMDESLDALIAHAIDHLTAYQSAGWAQRFAHNVKRVHARETALPAGDATLPLTHSVARSLLKLMSYKDEYEVARLYSNGDFLRQLAEQFDGSLKLEFHFAPPWLARPARGAAPAKLRVGPWMLPVMKWLARGKVLRGTLFDPFGKTKERRTERELIVRFEQLVERLLHELAPSNQALAAQIASLPLTVRGFGHVKSANLALAQARESELLHRFSPQRYARPDGAPVARQFRGIAVVAR
jgi:indolepyruvate ferredoxin oxidoreductase